jgi:hypothetical protein
MVFSRFSDKFKKADKLQRNRSRQRRRVENKDQGREAAISETQTVCCSPNI